MSPAKTNDSLLTDMLNACKEVSEFMDGVSFDEFLSDRMLCRATERCLEIVGEAASRVTSTFRELHPEIPWHRLRGLRNVLAHDYGEIVEEVIYQCATLEVPTLIAILERILWVEPDKPDSVREPLGDYRRRRVTRTALPVIRIAEDAPILRMSIADLKALEAEEEATRVLGRSGDKFTTAC
jgi:uncharacterized protein with HEPN domain